MPKIKITADMREAVKAVPVAQTGRTTVTLPDDLDAKLRAACERDANKPRDWEALAHVIVECDMLDAAMKTVETVELPREIYDALNSFERYVAMTGYNRRGFKSGSGRTIGGIKTPSATGKNYDAQREHLFGVLTACGFEVRDAVYYNDKLARIMFEAPKSE